MKDRQPHRHDTGRRAGSLGLLAVLLWFSSLGAASTPLPFAAEYEARYGGFKASAVRSLQHTPDGGIEMNTRLELKFFGQTISRINEASYLAPDTTTGEIRPESYTYEQTGLGKRSRSVSFDWDRGIATTVIGRQEDTLPLEGTAMDNLSGYLALRDQLQAGKEEVSFQGIDKNELEEFHYQVVGEETVDTEAGRFRALKLERIRDTTSNRNTEIWLALDWDYLLIKLVQTEPGSNTISLELTRATLDGNPVTPDGKEG